MKAKRLLSVTLGAVFVLGSANGAALAQSQYPTSSGKSAGLGTYGIVRDKPREDPEREPSKRSGAKWVCTVGKNSVVIVDADSVGTGHRDCYEVDQAINEIDADEARVGTTGSVHQTGPKSR